MFSVCVWSAVATLLSWSLCTTLPHSVCKLDDSWASEAPAGQSKPSFDGEAGLHWGFWRRINNYNDPCDVCVRCLVMTLAAAASIYLAPPLCRRNAPMNKWSLMNAKVALRLWLDSEEPVCSLFECWDSRGVTLSLTRPFQWSNKSDWKLFSGTLNTSPKTCRCKQNEPTRESNNTRSGQINNTINQLMNSS